MKRAIYVLAAVCFWLQALNSYPQKLIDVGGFKLHLYEMGQQYENKPTVVLDTFLGGNVLEWSLVQSEVAEFAHVCSYDRAGLGWSEASPSPRSSLYIVEELRTLLRNANIQPPYILVGHSSGGINMRLFVNRYPEEVFGLVLVDSSHEEQLDKILALKDRFNPPVLNSQSNLNWLPAALHSLYQELDASSQAHIATKAERKYFQQSAHELQQSVNALEDKPLVVITRGTKVLDQAPAERLPYELALHALWMDFQKDLVAKSKHGKQIIAPGCGHMIQRERPDIIIAAIKEMVGLHEFSKKLLE